MRRKDLDLNLLALGIVILVLSLVIYLEPAFSAAVSGMETRVGHVHHWKIMT